MAFSKRVINTFLTVKIRDDTCINQDLFDVLQRHLRYVQLASAFCKLLVLQPASRLASFKTNTHCFEQSSLISQQCSLQQLTAVSKRTNLASACACIWYREISSDRRLLIKTTVIKQISLPIKHASVNHILSVKKNDSEQNKTRYLFNCRTTFSR
jgi:hypothetical protein